MPLYHHSGVCVESWVELSTTAPMRYEVDTTNDAATLFFGDRNEYVMRLSRKNLGQMLELGSRAAADLASATPDDE
ncbi:hypothetical protein ALI144C_09235 [Actinosynnema sp. ALI-1.44]|uniref:hypothetical protein n=1 Tax=Actinosynnema sp. ALI-1.44 TaxID=1933779 RepID=UPI00097C4B5D|nr:hypothetical protein [Actinosynnema sp. ALI-1.44]ONI87555.1 hypothetical protein ALI144C_09235 [Actinosynnema sp. ALI-1.44]